MSTSRQKVARSPRRGAAPPEGPAGGRRSSPRSPRARSSAAPRARPRRSPRPRAPRGTTGSPPPAATTRSIAVGPASGSSAAATVTAWSDVSGSSGSVVWPIMPPPHVDWFPTAPVARARGTRRAHRARARRGSRSAPGAASSAQCASSNTTSIGPRAASRSTNIRAANRRWTTSSCRFIQPEAEHHARYRVASSASASGNSDATERPRASRARRPRRRSRRCRPPGG